MTRRAARVDQNHAEIVTALRKAGRLVQSLAGCGCGVPDLLVHRGGRLWLLEVKDGNKPPSARKLTPDQEEWISQGWPVTVVMSAEEAIKATE